MKTKLTLSVDKSIVRDARNQAQSDGSSVSRMFSEFVIAKKAHAERNATPSVKSMIGSLKSYQINDSKADLRSSYANKHFS